MTSPVMDRGRFPPTLWRALGAAGLEPPKVLRLAGLPSSLHLDASTTFSTTQLFAIWKAVETIADDPALALRLLEAADRCGHQPAFISALYAADFRDAVQRIERFKRMGACEVFTTEQRRITGEATTFRALLSDARRELSQQLLADPEIHIDEVTYLLGYQDATSFYRAFRDWAGVSPGEWRAGVVASCR